MNKQGKGNIMLGLLFFLMGLGVLAVFVTPISEFTDLMQQSDSLNCRGFIYNGNENHVLSFNDTMHGGASGSPMSCLALKLYLPYILATFLIGGVSLVLAGRASSMFGMDDEE